MSASQVDGIVVRLQGIDAPEREQTCRDKRARLYRCGKAQHCPTTPLAKCAGVHLVLRYSQHVI